MTIKPLTVSIWIGWSDAEPNRKYFGSCPKDVERVIRERLKTIGSSSSTEVLAVHGEGREARTD